MTTDPQNFMNTARFGTLGDNGDGDNLVSVTLAEVYLEAKKQGWNPPPPPSDDEDSTRFATSEQLKKIFWLPPSTPWLCSTLRAKKGNSWIVLGST